MAPWSLAECVALLKDAAAIMDRDNESGKSRRANFHEFKDPDLDASIDEAPDDPISYEAFAAACSGHQPTDASMNRETWESLAPATKTSWDQDFPIG